VTIPSGATSASGGPNRRSIADSLRRQSDRRISARRRLPSSRQGSGKPTVKPAIENRRLRPNYPIGYDFGRKFPDIRLQRTPNRMALSRPWIWGGHGKGRHDSVAGRGIFLEQDVLRRAAQDLRVFPPCVQVSSSSRQCWAARSPRQGIESGYPIKCVGALPARYGAKMGVGRRTMDCMAGSWTAWRERGSYREDRGRTGCAVMASAILR